MSKSAKQEKFEKLAPKEMLAKRNELVKELLKARLSLDPATVTAEGGLMGVRKDLKALARKLGTAKTARGQK